MRQESPDPDSTDTNGRGYIRPVNPEPLLAECRLDDPEHIDEPYEDHVNRNPVQQPRILLYEAHEQQKEWHAKVEDANNYPKHSPSAREPANVPGNLLWQIAGPDDQEL